MLPQRSPFGVTRNGEPIQNVEVRDTVDPGISYDPLLPGLVPLFEEREAAVFSHYNWIEWQELPVGERAMAVAHLRLRKLIDLHGSDAVQRDAERRRSRADAQRY